MVTTSNEGYGSNSTPACSVNMVYDQDIDGSSQLSSVSFDHVYNSHSDELAPASAADWFTKGRLICYQHYVIMHI